MSNYYLTFLPWVIGKFFDSNLFILVCVEDSEEDGNTNRTFRNHPLFTEVASITKTIYFWNKHLMHIYLSFKTDFVAIWITEFIAIFLDLLTGSSIFDD